MFCVDELICFLPMIKNIRGRQKDREAQSWGPGSKADRTAQPAGEAGGVKWERGIRELMSSSKLSFCKTVLLISNKVFRARFVRIEVRGRDGKVSNGWYQGSSGVLRERCQGTNGNGQEYEIQE